MWFTRQFHISSNHKCTRLINSLLIIETNICRETRYCIFGVGPRAIFVTHSEDHMRFVPAELCLNIVKPETLHLIGFSARVRFLTETITCSVVVSTVNMWFIIEVRFCMSNIPLIRVKIEKKYSKLLKVTFGLT